VARRERRPSTEVVTRNRRLAETALRPSTPVFIHGDLQVDHVVVAGNEVIEVAAALHRRAGTSTGSFGVSVFAAPEYDLAALSRSHLAIRRRSQVRTARCGTLRGAGFEVAATCTNPGHTRWSFPRPLRSGSPGSVHASLGQRVLIESMGSPVVSLNGRQCGNLRPRRRH
jgi:hypothetical protein